MADLLNVKFQGDKGILEGKLENIFDMAKAKHLLRKAVDDIADGVEDQAKRTVPVETGALRLHPVDRDDTRIGVATGIPSFGGGVSIRGAGGRFTGAARAIPGELVARSTIALPTEPKHAIFVHNGTGIYGPKEEPYGVTAAKKAEGITFMTFPRWSKARASRPFFRIKEVQGQKAQPYLENAFLLIDRTYVPTRIQILRAQIAAET